MYLTIYTDNLPADVGGCANGPVVRIRPKYRDDAGIHAHEYLHVEQFWTVSLAAVMLLGGLIHAAGLPAMSVFGYTVYPISLCGLGFAVHSLLYHFVHAYRLWSEVSCYREQLRHYPDDRTALFAGFIAQRYGLRVSVDAVEKMLR